MAHAAVVRPVAARRPARAVGRQPVVGAAVRPEAVRRADRDGRGLLPRRVDGAVELLPRGVLPVVARRRDDHHARVNQPAHGVARGVVTVGVGGRRPQRKIDDANLVERAVLQDPFERREQPGGRAAPLGVEHAQVDELRRRGHAAVRPVRRPARTRGDGGDVRPVPEGVVRATLAREVNARRDAAQTQRVAEDFVPRVQPRIHDRDADARAVERGRRLKQPEQRRGRLRPDVRDARRRLDVPRGAERPVGRDVANLRTRGQLAQRRSRHPRRHRAEPHEVSRHAPADRVDEVDEVEDHVEERCLRRDVLLDDDVDQARLRAVCEREQVGREFYFHCYLARGAHPAAAHPRQQRAERRRYTDRVEPPAQTTVLPKFHLFLLGILLSGGCGKCFDRGC